MVNIHKKEWNDVYHSKLYRCYRIIASPLILRSVMLVTISIPFSIYDSVFSRKSYAYQFALADLTDIYWALEDWSLKILAGSVNFILTRLMIFTAHTKKCGLRWISLIWSVKHIKLKNLELFIRSANHIRKFLVESSLSFVIFWSSQEAKPLRFECFAFLLVYLITFFAFHNSKFLGYKPFILDNKGW